MQSTTPFRMTGSLPNSLPAFIRHFMKRQRVGYFVLFSTSIASILDSNALPYALKLMVNAAVRMGKNTDHAFAELIVPVTIFIGLWVLTIVIFRIQERVNAVVRPNFEADVRMGILDYVKGHSYDYFSNNFAGTIAGKISDMPRIGVNLYEFMRSRVLSTALVVLVTIVLLSAVSPMFSAILATWAAIHVSIAVCLARKIAVLSRQNAENRSILAGHIVDLLTNMSTARLFARKIYEQQYVGQSQEIEKLGYRKVLLTMLKVRSIMSIPQLFTYAATLLLLVKGVQSGWVTTGDIVFVMFSISNVMARAWDLGIELPEFFNNVGIGQQALTLINRPHGIVDVTDAKPLIVERGEIVFDDVHFQYLSGRDIFRDKNITIKSGERVGLVGFSGSGKSTFVNLILRLYDIKSGRILIDGQDIAHVTQDSLRESIAMIPQDASLFHRTLMENIRYGRIDATDDEVIEASRQAHCHEFITHLPDGYASLVGERGIKLSGGQRQRIAIARAILKDASILILDEATSSLDSVTEKYIQESLHRLMENRTTIVIAHRLSTIAEMDRIIVFEEGAIIEDGNHQALLAQNGHYALLWRTTAGEFLSDNPDIDDQV
ncbi:MAG TPA: ABC transporter ATP-binding protein [Candidatus Baltobacteraceae bacterium]|jgi:ATP-binding cassette subfamily B protein|nr:ABC transporter ATP-binding protein [Candidatus Baltobacteraceae bacterium]